MADPYEGPVCYQDGWHWTVENEQPGEKLVCEDDGTYRLATNADTESWHDRKHASAAIFKTVPLDDEEQAALDEFRRTRAQ